MAMMILRMTMMVMAMMMAMMVMATVMAMMMFSLELLECTALPPCGPRVPPSPSQINGSHDDDDDGGCVLHCHSNIYKPIKKTPQYVWKTICLGGTHKCILWYIHVG